MRTFAAIVLFGLVAVACGELHHYITYKSFDEAFLECGQYYEVKDCELKQYVAESYPNKPEVRRLVRCALLNLNSWNDDTGVVKHQVTNFFKPSQSDDCYLNRTLVCLNSVRERCAPKDVNTAAYESFVCYYRNYGNLVSEEQFLRHDALEHTQVLDTVSGFLELSQETLVEFCKGNILKNDKFPAVLYQSSVRYGFYNVTGNGVQLERLYNQYGNPQLLAPETHQCVDKVAHEYCSADDVTIMYQTHVQCLDSLVPTVKLLQEFAKTQVYDPSVCDCTSPQVQVYNVL
ncbi:general odorant-binding protein 69-like [Armigeres subalbatus]|uniref:general odorant-binding protein 69-like n=1 Tax=Armigeres subalbatus TaxID=124917 RepID=UPI002ED21D49